MDFWKLAPTGASSSGQTHLNFSNSLEKMQLEQQDRGSRNLAIPNVDVDLREVYFLIMHFLSLGPCQRTFGNMLSELVEHELLPRRYHAWFSRSGVRSGNDEDDGVSLPLPYNKLVERYSYIDKDHLVKLMKQLLLHTASPTNVLVGRNPLNAADVPTLLGSGGFSLLDCDRIAHNHTKPLPVYLRWPHMHADQVRGLSLRELGGGFTKHHRAPSTRAPCYAIAKPSTMMQKMQNIKRIRGHRNAVYCAIFDRSGRYVITGSDDRLVKIWSMETAFCLTSCRGHEGDITDLAVSSNNALVASASNDFVIRVWRLPDGMPISVLRGHTGAVTTIAFSPRPSAVYQLLSSSDDGTCRIWDARYSQCSPRVYISRPPDAATGKSNAPSNNGPSSSNGPQSNQILCCAYNANGTVFVTGSSDTYARVWNALKSNVEEPEKPVHEMDLLCGHENDVNYVQFSGCAATPRSSMSDAWKEDNIPKFKNSWFCHDNIVTCSRDGSAIIWTPRSRRSHGKSGHWAKAYHLKVPPPPLPPQPPRGGPRQRILPTPRGVNMIVWSLDNHFVLAAVMDCRICVWNAVDGSLVHSLTGHTASSYVLDVHPFNPRIAMSAGYDGKTIVWDIWEGVPIRTYEIGRFKLVDGKFSPDGMSIVLSDDVGQIYLLNTGQGEAQKDAKYDQFFLGDYRPLIRDTVGNVLDQETQLPPHRRNVQDPLCDSSMIPYPEPYQTMFQKRRLGALGVEWRPSTIKFAIGPDFSLGQDYQMPPLEDLDRMIEPLPEFIDATLWEPENEVISDNNDSEYDAAGEYPSEAERGLSYSDPSDPDSSSHDSGVERGQRDGLRRSRRKKHKEVEVTSSRRRGKKRSLNNQDNLASSSGAKKLKSGRKASKRKSKAIVPRPQRVAARNALHMFSKYTGTSTDEDDQSDSEEDTSISDSLLQDSNVQAAESEKYLHYVQEKHIQEAEAEAEGFAKPPALSEPQLETGNRKPILLKFSLRGSKNPASPAEGQNNCESQAKFVNLSSKPVQGSRVDYKDTVSTSTDVPDVELLHGLNGTDTTCRQDPEMHDVYKDESADRNKIKWGEVKTRTSVHKNNINSDKDGMKNQDHRIYNSCPEEISTSSVEASQLKVDNDRRDEDGSGSAKCGNSDSVEIITPGPSDSKELKESHRPKLTKLKIISKGSSRDPGGSSKHKSIRTIDEFDEHHVMTEVNEAYVSSSSHGSGSHLAGASTGEMHQPGSVKIKPFENDSIAVNQKIKLKLSHNQGRRSDNGLYEERMFNSKMTVRPRSSRNTRDGDHLSSVRSPIGLQPTISTRKLSWLMLTKHEEGYRYIPQQGDDVAYLRQGHQEYIESTGSRERPPWISYKIHIGAVEICRVESLEYSTSPGSGDSCCKITLKFSDPSSSAFGRAFRVTLPELVNFPDFIVEKARYDASIRRNWTSRDKCWVWWRNDNDEGGSWWEGRILLSQAKSAEFPESPWERLLVSYDTEPPEDQRHSPWELHDPRIPWDHPHIDIDIRDELLSSFAKLERKGSKNQDYYGIQKLSEVSHKLDFLNRFPVPLGPGTILERLNNDYYRSLDALGHDIDVMMENAKSYFVKSHDLSNRMRRLSDWFEKTLSNL